MKYEDMTKRELIVMAKEMQALIGKLTVEAAYGRAKTKIRNSLYDLHEYTTGIYHSVDSNVVRKNMPVEKIKEWANMILAEIEIIKEALNGLEI